MYALPAPTQSVRRWEMDGPSQRAWGAVIPAAAPWGNGSFWVRSGSVDLLLGDVPGPWPLRRWGAHGPSAPGEMSSLDSAKQGLGAVTGAKGPSRAAPSDEVGAGDAHPALSSHRGDRASQDAKLGQDHRLLTEPAGVPDSAGTTAPCPHVASCLPLWSPPHLQITYSLRRIHDPESRLRAP